MKICPLGADLFHADGRIDGHDEVNIGVSQFCGEKKTLNQC